jgi:hypothetical protein
MEHSQNGIQSSETIRSDYRCSKEKIFTMTDVSKRKTKIVCTIG